jgi:AcrR family transcriptional regulator
VIDTSKVDAVADVKRNRRQEKAAATRRRMLDAAYDLFCAEGYRTTTMQNIADRAGVVVQTLYFTFHTKDELLQAVHERTVLGDDPLPPPLQSWYLAAIAEPDVRAAVRITVEGVATIFARVAPMLPVFHSVVGDPAGEVWQRGEELRLEGMKNLVDALADKATLRRGLTGARAVDALFVVMGPELYRSLVIERGWSIQEWSTWVAATLLRDLFGLTP